MDEKKVFTDIYHSNKWGSTESMSGSGSTLGATKFLVDELNLLLKQYAVKSLLDVPCGDFNWMRKVDLAGIEYIGGDIVEELIAANRARYPALNFQVMNIIRDPLPKADLVFCRDCLSHFPSDLIRTALDNIRRSGSGYLLTTTFTWQSRPNIDVKLGAWRPLNLELPPFNLPRPLEVIVEGTFRDKSIALWPLDQL